MFLECMYRDYKQTPKIFSLACHLVEISPVHIRYTRLKHHLYPYFFGLCGRCLGASGRRRNDFHPRGLPSPLRFTLSAGRNVNKFAEVKFALEEVMKAQRGVEV